MVLEAMAGQVRRVLFRLRLQARARSAPRMEFRRIWLFHDCIGVVSGNRPRADERLFICRAGTPASRVAAMRSAGVPMGTAPSNMDLDRSGSGATNATPSSPSVEELVAFERMLADLSARMANVPSDRVEPEIQLAQVILREFLVFDGSTFAELQADSSLVVVSSTAVDGVDATPLGPLPPQLDWFIAKIREGETLVMQDPPDDLLSEAVGEDEYVQRTGLRSHLSIPLRIGGRVIGAIAFSAFKETRNWPDDFIARVMLVGEVFAHAIARKREHGKLLAAMAEIRLLKDRLERENSYLKQAVQVRPPQRLTGRSSRFLSVVEEIKQVALTSSTVLLLGETGSGKEVLAQAIHDSSAQKDRGMIKGKCAALPASLIDAELFGREKGGCTGALARQPGRFEIADGSTIFLDEIGELPLELQPKVLRVLQEGEFERLGGSRTIKVDARVIAATNRPLAQAVQEGRFREDLFYRLDVFPVEVPPLRERSEDIPLLSWAFVKEFSNSMGKAIDSIGDDSMAALLAYPWPVTIPYMRIVDRSPVIPTPAAAVHI